MSENSLRLRVLRLAGVPGKEDSYGVSFTDDRGEWRPLSIIAGPSQTGKSSIAGFVKYCLGDDEQPQHPEIIGAVRSALLEVELAGTVVTIERAASGSPSSFASVWRAGLDGLRTVRETRVPIEPTSDPEGLSQLVLSGFSLDGVALPEAPSKDESRLQLLSVRDVFRVMFLPNERLDNKDLAYENANYMVRQKFRQLIDVVFGVYDPEGPALQASIRVASEAVAAARRYEDSLRQLAQEDFPAGATELQRVLEEAGTQAVVAENEIASLDAHRRTSDGALADLRARLDAAQAKASTATVRVRDRRSLLGRLAALRAQYADDKKKLTFLKDAERLFDPLSVITCPACMSKLTAAPALVDGRCTLCGNSLDGESRAPGAAEGDGGQSSAASVGEQAVLAAELRAVSRRLVELNDYWERLDTDLARLERLQHEAEAAAEAAAEALNQVVQTPAPWLAARDEASARRAQAKLTAQAAQGGLKVWGRVADAQEARERLEVAARRLRDQRTSSRKRPDRQAIVRALSDRFAKILADFEYPKLSNALVDGDLVPHVRGLPYSQASSGGLVLISLAYHLAIWELAFERNAAAPGLLVIDSPQKNLGHAADRGDPDFADTRLVENFYRHVKTWLSGDGLGAQLIIVDNSPPESVSEDVVVHYTRDPNLPPYGLITDAVE